MQLAGKIESYIRRHGLLEKGNRLIVAVSGGADSMALLHLLCALRSSWRLEITAAHLDHQLRGEESKADAEFVTAAAAALEVPFRLQRCDVRALADQEKGNLESVGRGARRRFLTSLAQEIGARRIALGHHRNDQAETVLHHLLRGAGTRGLRGMQPVSSGIWIRPLLDTGKDEILTYIKGRRLFFREDLSNFDMRYTRNRIRQELLPALARSFNPQVIHALHQTAYLAQRDEDYLCRVAAQESTRITRTRRDGFSWSVDELRTAHPAIRFRILLAAMESLAGKTDGFSFEHLQQTADLLEEGKSGKEAILPEGLVARRQFAELVLGKERNPRISDWKIRLVVPGITESPDGLWRMETQVTDGREPLPPPVVGQPTAILPWPEQSYELRNGRAGDVYRQRHHRSLKRLWNDVRVPLEARHRLPLVVEDQRVVWIPGFPPSFDIRFPADPRAGRLRLSLQPYPDSPLAAWLADPKR